MNRTLNIEEIGCGEKEFGGGVMWCRMRDGVVWNERWCGVE